MGGREDVYQVSWREDDRWRSEMFLSGHEADQLYWSLRLGGNRSVYVVQSTRERQQG